MANQIQAIATYRPKIDLARTVSTAELAEFIEGRTALNHGEIQNVLMELNNGVKFFALQGVSTKIEGLAG